jgi:hypothetical protein
MKGEAHGEGAGNHFEFGASKRLQGQATSSDWLVVFAAV